MQKNDRFVPQELIELLVDARRSGSQISEFPLRLVPPTVEDAYRINASIAERLGWQQLGWKIAATTEAVRTKLGTEGPIYGRTFRRFRHESPVRLKHAELLDPLVECEFFVTLSRDLAPREEPWSMAEVIDAIGAVNAGIEVAECRFPMNALPPLPAILADGSASGRYVFGDAISGWHLGLESHRVLLDVDGKQRRSGSGKDVMGDPVAPLVWLAEERRRSGEGLKAGQTISTGSMTGMLPIQAGQHVVAHFGSDATVEITFEV